MSQVTLPPKNNDEGLEARVLLAECLSPAYQSYTLAAAKDCMQLMDRVLYNRVRFPRKFGLKTGASLLDVVTAPGQFAGFASYPNYDASVIQRIQDMLNIANSSRDSRSGVYTSHIQAALDVSHAASIVDPSGGILGSWRTAGASSPGGSFKFYKTVLGNDFYSIP